jgi:hypothetical protein
MLCRSFFVLLYFLLLAIVLSDLLRCMDSDYPFGIFKLFLYYMVYAMSCHFSVKCYMYIHCKTYFVFVDRANICHKLRGTVIVNISALFLINDL